MKDKQCPYCKGRAEIKPLLDPHKKSGDKDRFMMFEYSCSAKGCYLQEGAGNYVDKNNLKVLTDQWANIPEYVKPAAPKKPKIVKKAVKKKTFTTHYSISGKSDIPCCSKTNAKEWTDDAHKVTCERCLSCESVKLLLKHRRVS